MKTARMADTVMINGDFILCAAVSFEFRLFCDLPTVPEAEEEGDVLEITAETVGPEASSLFGSLVVGLAVEDGTCLLMVCRGSCTKAGADD